MMFSCLMSWHPILSPTHLSAPTQRIYPLCLISYKTLPKAQRTVFHPTSQRQASPPQTKLKAQQPLLSPTLSQTLTLHTTPGVELLHHLADTLCDLLPHIVHLLVNLLLHV